MGISFKRTLLFIGFFLIFVLGIFVLNGFFSTAVSGLPSNTKLNCSVCEKDQYKDECYYECALHNGDISVCEKTSSIDYKNHCYAYVSIKTEESFCDKIVGGDDPMSSDKTACYLHFATKGKDISLCDNIPMGDWHLPRYSCYQQVAVALQDPSLCAKIPNIYPIPGYEKDTAVIDNLKQLKSDCLILKQTYN